MNQIIKFFGAFIDSLFDLSEREPSEKTWVVVCIIGICIAEYVYYITNDEGYFLTAIFVAILGAFISAIIFNFLRVIPALLALVIIVGIVIGVIVLIIKFIEFLSEIRLWSK